MLQTNREATKAHPAVNRLVSIRSPNAAQVESNRQDKARTRGRERQPEVYCYPAIWLF